MAISAKQVSELRNATGLGMMECKKALTEADGDMEKAIENLRKRGEMKAAKRSGKATSNGKIKTAVSGDNGTGALVELNCETDFVAKTEDFESLLTDTAEIALEKGADGVHEEEGALPEVDEKVKATIGKIGENIRFKRFAKFSAGDDGMVATYIHTGGQIGVMVELEAPRNEAAESLGLSLCQQIAFSQPMALCSDEIPDDVVEKEREVYRAQVTGKPDNIIDKIVEGKLRSFYAENCLLEQEYIRDNSKKVSDIIKEAGEGIKVRRFIRFQVGV